MPVRWQSVAASPATQERDVRSTSAGTTVRTEAPALLLIQVRAGHTFLNHTYFSTQFLIMALNTKRVEIAFPYLASVVFF